MKPKIYSFLVDDKSEHKKAKEAYRIFETLSRNEYKDVLLNNTFLRHSMNRTQSKDQIIGKYETNKISLSYFDDKIYIQNSRYDGLVLRYQC